MAATGFRREFRNFPVPIRMSCLFTNGITLNYYARAVSCSNRVLRVLSVNPFERGILLCIVAPFLQGLVRCRVAGVARSQQQASCFEVELRFLDEPRPASGDSSDSPSGPQLADDIAAAAASLARALESSIGVLFAQALGQARPPDRHLALLASAGAVLMLLEKKGYAELGRALEPVTLSPARQEMAQKEIELLRTVHCGKAI